MVGTAYIHAEYIPVTVGMRKSSGDERQCQRENTRHERIAVRGGKQGKREDGED